MQLPRRRERRGCLPVALQSGPSGGQDFPSFNGAEVLISLWRAGQLFFVYEFREGGNRLPLQEVKRMHNYNVNPLLVLVFVLVVFAIMMILALNSPG